MKLKEKSRAKSLDIVALLFLILLNYIMSNPGSIKYILCFILLLTFSIKHNLSFNGKIRYFIPNIAYMIFGFFLSIINNHLTLFSLKLSLLFIIPFIFAVLLTSIFKENVSKLVELQFYSLLFLYLIIERAPGESQLAFTFGLYVIYFFCSKSKTKKQKIFIVSLLLLIMIFFTGKRLAVFLSFLIILIIPCFKLLKIDKQKHGKRIIYILCFLSLIYIYGCHEGLYDYLKLNYGILVSGREYIYNLFKKYYNLDWRYIGKGIGWTFEKITSFNLIGAGNLHNDLLMTYIDLGLIGYIIWFISFNNWINNKKNSRLCIPILMIIIYTIGNYMTDNIMIYINYWLTAYLMLFSYSENEINKYDDMEKKLYIFNGG